MAKGSKETSFEWLRALPNQIKAWVGLILVVFAAIGVFRMEGCIGGSTWSGTLVRTQQREGRPPEKWPMILRTYGPLQKGSKVFLDWDTPSKHSQFVVDEFGGSGCILKCEKGPTEYRVEILNDEDGALRLRMYENESAYSEEWTPMKHD